MNGILYFLRYEDNVSDIDWNCMLTCTILKTDQTLIKPFHLNMDVTQYIHSNMLWLTYSFVLLTNELYMDKFCITKFE